MTTATEHQQRRGIFRRARTDDSKEPVEVSSDPIPLPTDEADNETAVPCRCCGIAVQVTPGMQTESADLVTRYRKTWSQKFGRCADCASYPAQAVAIVARHPGLSARYGSVVTDRLEAALLTLRMLGVPCPDPATLTRREVDRLLRFLSGGAGMQWLPRAEEAPGYSQPFPFAHLTDENRAVLRSAYAAVLADRIAATTAPVAVAPPPIGPHDLKPGAHPVTGGCLMCGVGAVEVSASDSRDVWTLRRGAVSPHQLGGRRSPMTLQGYTCPDCTAALNHNHMGAFGPSAMDRALVVALGVERRWIESSTLSGLVGWGALVADAVKRQRSAPAPNRTPWAHVAGLDSLRKQIDSGLVE